MKVPVDCPRCHRPVAELVEFGGRVTVVGTVRAEHGDSAVTTWAGPARQWAAVVYVTDPTLPPGTTAAVSDRHTFECGGRRCRSKAGNPHRRSVSVEALTAGYRRAMNQGAKRISLLDLKG